MEPMLPREGDKRTEDLAATLIAKASSLAGQLNDGVKRAVGKLVRSMNCYYSNQIEGHDTHPRDIDRALSNDYSKDPKKRNLQLEAKAHIELQGKIDEGTVPHEVVSKDFILWLHSEFTSRLPEELRWVTTKDKKRSVEVIPGKLRDGDVQVGAHLPPGEESLERFLKRFIEAYHPQNLSRIRQIVAVAASHHRLLWIHPFYDGNGRVTRLFSHSYLKDIGIGSSLWSVSRGLARRVEDYKAHLMAADEQRKGDLDGRGNLSEENLQRFVTFFLETCIDQVDYMSSILEPKELLNRIEIYTEEETRAQRLPKGAFKLIREAILFGEIERGKADEVTGHGERQARRVVSDLLEKRILESDGPKAPLKIGFPVDVLERWFPRLYPT